MCRNDPAKQDRSTIDFGFGFQAPDQLPVSLLSQASQSFFSSQNVASFLRYGPEKGPASTLISLASFLSSQVGYKTDNSSEKVKPEQLMLTYGSSAALSLVCQVYTVPGDVVIVESPSYFLAFGIFQVDHHLKVVSSPMDQDGLIVDENLEQLCQLHRPKLLYTIPVHQNPCGNTLSLERRKKLILLSKKYNFKIVADEIYQMLNFSGYVPPPNLVALDDESGGTVIGLGSFTKIVAPGLRLGWIQTKNNKFLSELSSNGVWKSGGGVNFHSGVIQSAMDLGYVSQIADDYRQQNEERTKYGITLLREHFSDTSKFHMEIDDVNGGYFIWAKFKNSALSSEKLVELCKTKKVGFKAGNLFSDAGLFSDYGRFCFIFWTKEQIEIGVERLVSAVATLDLPDEPTNCSL
eukprot:TRINITY_DN891_c0_g1_i1.p1 TRINITY_DN891_c0_g1~~TRINITY_DN891_c0_g1_i1.p1  ORF type:complete len:407 (-),score=64.49 TRINITY_DN891_c0_g1_i1:103-1323(-)